MIKKKIFYAITFLIFYVILILGNIGYDRYLDYKLKGFDLNNDGIFSPIEQTIEQQKYQFLVNDDIGRNLIPINGLFFSLVATVSVFVISKTYRYVIKFRKDINNK